MNRILYGDRIVVSIGNGGNMLRLAFRAALLDGGVYEEIRERQETAFSALGVVLVAGIAFGMGVWGVIRNPAQQGLDLDQNLYLVLAISSIFTSWVIWTVFVWLLGRILFSGREGYRASLRSLGVCYLPLSTWLLIGAPSIGAALYLMGAVWTLAAGVVAVKHIHDIAWWKAGIAAAVGWFWGVVMVTLFLVILPLTAGTAA